MGFGGFRGGSTTAIIIENIWYYFIELFELSSTNPFANSQLTNSSMYESILSNKIFCFGYLERRRKRSNFVRALNSHFRLAGNNRDTSFFGIIIPFNS